MELPIDVIENIAGPSEEIDKLMSVNWSMLSSESAAGRQEFIKCERVSDNEMRLALIDYTDL